jgi:hypothetical protein
MLSQKRKVKRKKLDRLQDIVRTPLHPTFGKNNIDDFRSKSSIFFKGGVLPLSGRAATEFTSPHFYVVIRNEYCGSKNIQKRQGHC